jgi:hypothetical protein
MKGNYFRPRFNQELAELYPKSLFCNLNDGRLGDWKRSFTPKEVKEIAREMYVQAPLGEAKRISEILNANASAVVTGGGEAIYKID